MLRDAEKLYTNSVEEIEKLESAEKARQKKLDELRGDPANKPAKVTTSSTKN